jgi:hypothetical protein
MMQGEMTSKIAMAKAALDKKIVITSKLDLNLRKKLVKCCIWSIDLYGAATWCWRRTEKISWNQLCVK